MTDLATQIEIYLLQAGGFVSTGQICERFGINQRALRQDRDRPGLLDSFAVSSTDRGQHGYCHHKFLPTKDWLPIKHRLRRHALAELRRVRAWDRARRQCLTAIPTLQERHTGQTLLPI